MLHDVRTLYIAAVIIVTIFAGLILGGLVGAPGWVTYVFMVWLAVTCIVAILRNVKHE